MDTYTTLFEATEKVPYSYTTRQNLSSLELTDSDLATQFDFVNQTMITGALLVLVVDSGKILNIGQKIQGPSGQNKRFTVSGGA